MAQQENRYWLAFERELQYLAASSFRFMEEDTDEDSIRLLYEDIMSGETQEIVHHLKQLRLFEKAKRYPA